MLVKDFYFLNLICVLRNPSSESGLQSVLISFIGYQNNALAPWQVGASDSDVRFFAILLDASFPSTSGKKLYLEQPYLYIRHLDLKAKSSRYLEVSTNFLFLLNEGTIVRDFEPGDLIFTMS
jgi:hypothetical protein